MGTRGYYCYRFRGRLYVYYNHYDSYPNVLGKFLIENIPTDPEEYQQWLLRLRARFNEHEKILDQEILTLPEPGTELRYSTVLYDYGPARFTQSLPAWQFYIDERLECLPSYSTAPCIDLFIEWVYTFDLDREIVNIQSQSAETSFKLNAIPRQLQWAKNLEGQDDEEGHLVTAGHPVGQSYASLLTPVTGLESLVAKYDSFQITAVKARTLPRPLSRGEHGYIVRELLFSQFVEKRSSQLSEYILQCGPADFIYREVLFAILSLASGDFGLLADQSPVSGRRDDLQVRIGCPNGPNILPYFASGMHASNVLPGSAPDSSVYWFKGVVVLVADPLVDADSLKAAVATATEFGRESGHKIFDALVTDIQSFTLVRVNDTGVLQQTELIDLINDVTLPMPGGESSDESDHEQEATSLTADTCGFGILMNFFDVAASYTLSPCKPAKRALPNELYDKIIDMVDPDTYVKCSEVSNTFRHYVQQHIRLSQQPELNYSPELTTSYSHHTIEGVSVSPKLTIFDTVKGEKVESILQPHNERTASSWWAPVIGHDKRQSMIIDCAISAPALASHTLPIAEDRQYPLDDPEYASFIKEENRVYSGLRTFGSDHFYIPRFASVRDVSLAWESYLGSKLMKSPATGQPLRWGVFTEAHRYLLPPSTGSIPLEPYNNMSPDPNGKTYTALAGMVWLKKPTDFEVTLVRQQTVREAEEYLNSKMIEEAEQRRPTKQGVLVIAFGCKTQCFKWTLDDAADLHWILTPLADGAVHDIGITEQRAQFEELFGKMLGDLETARLLARDKEKVEAENTVSGSVGGTKEDVDSD